jgi:hypothetical protein
MEDSPLRNHFLIVALLDPDLDVVSRNLEHRRRRGAGPGRKRVEGHFERDDVLVFIEPRVDVDLAEGRGGVELLLA